MRLFAYLVRIRVVLFGQLVVRLFDLLVSGTSCHTKHIIEILREGSCERQQSTAQHVWP